MLKVKKKIKWSRKKILISSIAGVLVVSLIVGAAVIIKNRTSKTTLASAQRTVKVSRGNIEVSITGSGTVTSASNSDLMSNVEGKITKAYFKEGDQVKKGDLLYEIDDTDALLSIQKVENSISQAELSSSSDVKDLDNLNITAPFNGKVTNIAAVEGESVNNGMSLFTIVDTSKLTLSVPFSTSSIPNIKAGQKAQIHIQELMDTVDGTVTSIDSNSYTASNGGVVRNVEITVVNPGALTDAMTATADISTGSGIESGSQVCTFSYIEKKSVQASSSGTFEKVNVKENQYVHKGDVLIRIENDDLVVTSKTNDLKMEDLYNQLDAANKNLENYKIYSPIDGTITVLSAKEGDSVERGSALTSIRDFNQMQFNIPVDELDIAKVKVGQEVSITIDALTETEQTPLTGEVIYKAMEGTAENGVATYDVTVKINETKNLLAGMNANATIILNNAENVLTVPLEAVTKMGDKAFVRVIGNDKDASKASDENKINNAAADQTGRRGAQGYRSGNQNGNQNGQNNTARTSGQNGNSQTASNRRVSAAVAANQEYYANTTLKEVELGLNSDEYVEIKSGLTEGEVVVLPPLVASSNSTNTTNTQSGGFGIGGMGGGMPGGMPPGGGMQGGYSGQRQTTRQNQQR